jgi:hypothetical protein
MLIQTLKPPVAGEVFRFSVAGCSGTTKVQVFVNRQALLDREYNGMLCQSMAEIPAGVGGKTLSISAIDSAGHAKTLEYEISESDPGPHSMLSGTRRMYG